MKFAASLATAALTGIALTSVARADDPPPPPSGLVVLDQTGSAALSMVGSAEVEIPARAVYVNSSHKQAVSTTGTAILDAPFLYVVGGTRFNGQSRCTGEIINSVAPYSDPCSGTLNPSTAGMEVRVTPPLSGDVTMSPGYYPAGFNMTSSANVTFLPGVYVFGNGFTVKGGSVSGEGVCFIVPSGAFDLGGNGAISLAPSYTGPYANMVLFQPSSNTNEMKLSGGSNLHLTGTIYTPGATLRMVGSSEAVGEGPLMGDIVVAKRVDLRGTSLIKIGRPGSPPIQLPPMAVYD